MDLMQQIIQNNQLTPAELSAVNALYQQCQHHDQGAPVLYRHLLTEPRDGNKNALYYVNSQLVGFISLYLFYADACEITLFVHPKFRRQHIASRLLQQLSPLLKGYAVQQVIFSKHAPVSKRYDKWLVELGFAYQESEYCMRRLCANPAVIKPTPLMMRLATIHDIPAFIQIEQLCFAENPPHDTQHYLELLNNPQYTLVTASHQEQVIGKAHLYFEKNETPEASLSDIAILPAFQRQGFGGQLLAYSINHALSQHRTNLMLNVALDNQFNATQLYLQHGFEIEAQYDYWAIAQDKLNELIHMKP